ncbi:HEAT repeat-containing protein 3 [Pieris brassicae]|uniref:HEAT repeat-containing protein 3 n=1 Tax=Pieris brassicae TaxID=7116 RepID=UPI001E65FBAF|nr:HEAT repeat-containing protein 3 [Pieris brassicae]XP_045528351.1 HEAT repeat-containing protein 3 [Pieris brassicae]
MGKIRKRRPNKSQAPEVVESIEHELPLESNENAIQTIIDQLQTVNVEEKYCGLQTFAMLIESPENIEKIFEQSLIKIVAPLLLDPSVSVRNAAAGSLRNLSVLQHVCEALMEQDVMTPLVCYFHQFTETWTPDVNSKTKDEEIDTFIQCVNLLLNLCESSDLAVKYLTESRILDILPRYLDIATFGSDIVIAVLQCILVVVEDNNVGIKKIHLATEQNFKGFLLLDSNEPQILLIKTLAAGIVINICNGNIASLPVDVVSQIMQILAKTLLIDHRMACNQLSSSVPLQNGAGKIVQTKGKDTLVLQNQIKAVTHMLDAQQSAIEILANICSCEDDDEMEGDESSESEENIEDDLITNGETLHSEDKLPPEVLEAMISLELFDKVWSRTQLPAENVLLILKEYEESLLVYKKIHNLQTRALLCVNNILMALPIDKLGGVNSVYRIWVDAGKLVFKQNSDNLNLVESATAVMRAALDKIKFRENGNINNDSGLFSDLALTDIEIMLNGIKDCQVPEIRSNLIRMIGILALLLVNNINDTTTTVICTITEFLLDQAHKENEVWVLAEAIDTLVDLYSEDETDEIAAKVKLVEKLSILSPILKNKSRQQRKLPKEYKVLVSTVSSNLPRFIKYKKARICSL